MTIYPSAPLECDECGKLALFGTYEADTHSVTYRCTFCNLEFYDTNLDFDREDVEEDKPCSCLECGKEREREERDLYTIKIRIVEEGANV